ncbi:MAG: DUF72 domain-containing protein [Chloroflexi bacterium]|nr:DUF72 domain-containing protein [Chloroflexota bacterium]
MTGRLLVGTSGFSYPGWIPRLYPPGTRAPRFLATYATRFDAVELNNTFRRRPSASAIAGWLGATPEDFRFAIKAQRGSAVRALLGSAAESIGWLTEPLPHFGSRLGAVLFELPAEMRRDGPWCDGDPARADAALAAVLRAWPASIPLVVELPDASWHVDETFATLRSAGATLCATDLAGGEEPTLRRTSSRHYLRLRRDDYAAADLDAWAARVRPFIEAGDDVFVFFKHDPVGRAAELAASFAGRFDRT